MPETLATFTLDGEKFELDDFDLGELEWLEDYIGRPLVEIQNFMSLKVMSGMLYLVRKRKNPALTLEEHRKLKATALFGTAPADGDGDTGDGKAAKKRPPKPAAG